MLDIYYSRSDDGKTAQNLVFEFCNKNLEEIIQDTKKKANQLKYSHSQEPLGIIDSPEQKSPVKINPADLRIPMEDIKSYMKQILIGMAYVHK